MQCFIIFALSSLIVDGVFGEEVKTVEVKDGHSVTLHTDHSKSQTDDIKWYRDDHLIARINPSMTCTDVQCDAGNERFRDRLKLNHQTGSLTITNISTTDSGLYTLQISSISSFIMKTFSVSVIGVFGDEVKTVEVKEGDSVTLHTDHSKSQTDDIKWYRDDGLIARFNPSQVCTDVQCDAGNERFRDRLKLNHQTGSLTITNISTTDSGLYTLQISSVSSFIIKIFSVSVIASDPHSADQDPGVSSALSPGAVAGIIVGVLMIVAAVVVFGVIFINRKKTKRDGEHVI